MKKRLSEMQRTIQQRRQEIKGLYEVFVVGEITKSEYVSQKAALQTELDSIIVLADKLQAELDNCGTGGELQNSFVDTFKQYSEVQELTDAVVGNTLKAVFIYQDNRIEIVWNHQDDLQRLMLELGVSED